MITVLQRKFYEAILDMVEKGVAGCYPVLCVQHSPRHLLYSYLAAHGLDAWGRR